MSNVRHDPPPLEVRYREILSVVPASGVWAVRKFLHEDGNWRYTRDPILVWAVVRSPVDLTTEVVPMVEGDETALDFVDDACWLWSEAKASACECGYYMPPSWTAADRWWCRVCAALIDPPP